MFLGPLLQVSDHRIGDLVWELRQVPFQPSVHVLIARAHMGPGLVYRAGSTMKSWKELWKCRIGCLMSSWIPRSVCINDRRISTSSDSKLKSVATVARERGSVASMTAPRTDQTIGYSPGDRHRRPLEETRNLGNVPKLPGRSGP